MKKKLFLNTITSLLLQILTVLSGLIVPRMILQKYGSEVNGLVQSVSQFLSVITFLELGVGQVIQSALYKPLAEKNKEKISCILKSGEKFFRWIAIILIVYVIVLIGVYPYIIEHKFGWIYTAALIGAMSISSFAQYYFGIVDRILLNADQRGYIQYFSQIITLILNTIACIVLITVGASIQMVKFISSLIFLIRPFVIRTYINRHYNIDRNIIYTEEPIKQKWNGIAQHSVAFVMDGTDNIVLTIFSTLANVSIYSVYYMVIHGIRQLYQSMVAGLHSLIGDLWARKELEKLNEIFGYIETGVHFITVFLFGCVAILIVPFISVYTKGITDVNYVQPIFACLMTLAQGFFCLRSLYNMLILAGGHYRQTQRCHIVAATLNILISVATVIKWGLIGVAIGTCVAMLYQAVWMAAYDSRNLLKWPFRNFVKQFCVDVITVVLIYLATRWIELGSLTYLSWFIMAIKVAVIAVAIILMSMIVFYREKAKKLYRMKFVKQ